MSQQEWSSQYDILKRAVAQRRQSGVTYPQSEVSELGEKAEYLNKMLTSMSSSPMEYEISLSEIGRRQVVLENLRKQILMIAVSGRKLFAGNYNVISASGGNSGRNSLASSNQDGGMRNSNISMNSNSNGRASDVVKNPMNSTASQDNSTLTNKGLIQRHKETIALQDEMIEDISKGVDVLHHQAMQIGDESKVQMRILDEMDGNVDRAAIGLNEEAKHADNVRETSNACSMYICIVVEVIVIIVLLIVVFGLAK